MSAALLFLLSGFLFFTLVLNEPYLEPDANSRLDATALIGIPAVLGVLLAVLAFRRGRARTV